MNNPLSIIFRISEVIHKLRLFVLLPETECSFIFLLLKIYLYQSYQIREYTRFKMKNKVFNFFLVQF